MTQTTVAADFAQPLDVHADFTAQVALDDVAMLDGFTQLSLLILGQILDADVRVNAGGLQDLCSTGGANAVDISQSNLN